MAGLLVGLLVIGGGTVLVSQMMASHTPHVGITTTTGLGQPFGGAAFLASDDLVTDQQWRERAAAFEAFKAKGPVLLDRAEPAQAADYVDKTIADPAQKQSIKAQLADKKETMVAIGFYDDCAEDGDVVEVRSGPVGVVVPLTHKVQYVLVPVPDGGTAEVTIAGVKDGTGGITLGMVTPEGVVHMPDLQPGQQTSFVAR